MRETRFLGTPGTRLGEIHGLLLERYGAPAGQGPWDPLTQLIDSLLTSRTKDATPGQAVRDLRARYATWDDVRDAPVGELARVIGEGTFAEAQAVRLKALLQGITARVGTLTLDFLAKYRTDKVRAWLEEFEGVGNQVSAAVVNFSTLRRRALCVDAQHLRVTQRLGLTPRADARTTEERLMRLVPADWTAERLEEHHRLVTLHGQQVCTFDEPGCSGCPLLARCPTGERLLAGRADG